MRFLALASRNFKESYRDRVEITALLAIPVLVMLVMGAILDNVDVDIGGLAIIDILAPGLMVIGMLLLMTFSSTLMTMDRQTGFLSRLATTPARASDFILGYSFGLIAIAIAQIAIYFVAAWILGMRITGHTWLVLLVVFLAALNSIALGMIIGSLARSKGQAEGLSMLIVLPTILPIVFMLLYPEVVPPSVAAVIYAFPFVRAIDTAVGVNALGLGLEVIRNDLLFLAGFAVVFLTIGIFLFTNCLVVSRVRRMLSYATAGALLAGLLCFGFLGGDFRISNHVSLDAFTEPSTSEAPVPDAAAAVSFPEHFEDGEAEGWRLGSGWEIAVVDGNYVMRGAGDKWSEARPKVDGWFDYTIETRVRLITGACSIHFRASDDIPFRSSYRLRMGERATILIRETDGDGSHLVERPPFLELGRWQKLEIAVAGNNVKVYVDDELKLDYTDDDRPLSFGGFFFSIERDSHVLWDYVDVHVVDSPGEAKEYFNEEHGLSIEYPYYYVEVQPAEPDCVFEAYSTARAPIRAPRVAICIEDVNEGTTFADLRELTETDFEAFGAMDIEVISERETTLADGTTPAHELILEWSMADAPRLKTLLLSALKADKWVSIGLTDSADYWSEMEAEILEIAYSLHFN